jgi:DNA modification methylase
MGIQPNEIYLGDCLGLMEGIEANSLDAIITDLPYG